MSDLMMGENIRQTLSDLTGRLNLLEGEKSRLTGQRDEAITAGRAVGMTWADINRACETKNIQVSWERHR